jgi:hypothetical protein
VAEKELAKEAAKDVVEKEAAENEAAGTEAVEKEAAEKEVVEKEAVEKEDDFKEEDQPGSHQNAATTTTLFASSLPFTSTICISTRTVYSSTSNT